MASNADIAEKDHLWMGTKEMFDDHPGSITMDNVQRH